MMSAIEAAHQRHDDPGLQVDDRYHVYPEAVPNDRDLPEVAIQEHQGFYADEKAAAISSNSVSENSIERGAPEPAPPAQGRILGLQRKTFFALAAVLALVVVGAVLGGVLGTQLGKKSSGSAAPTSSTSPSSSTATSAPTSSSTSSSTLPPGSPATEARDLSGLALLSIAGSQNMYGYYANELGNIVEINLPAGSGGQNLSTANMAVSNVSSDALPGSSIAAVSYTQNGVNFRRIFYFGKAGVLTAVTGSSGSWPSPGTSAIASTIQPARANAGLSAVADTASLQGIRVYFGCKAGYIQESGMNFAKEGAWNDWAGFPGSDAGAGVASVIVNNINNVYFRNQSTGNLQQWTLNYATAGTSENQPWSVGASLPAANPVATNGSIAVAADAQQTQYIYYQTANPLGQTQLATASGTSLSLSSNGAVAGSGLRDTHPGYPLAAAWNGVSAAVVLGQNSATPRELMLTTVAGSGGNVGTATLLTG